MADDEDPVACVAHVHYSIPIKSSEVQKWAADVLPMQGDDDDAWLDKVAEHVRDNLPDFLDRTGGPSDVEVY